MTEVYTDIYLAIKCDPRHTALGEILEFAYTAARHDGSAAAIQVYTDSRR